MAESAPQLEPLSRPLAGGSEYFFDYVCQPCSVDNKTLDAVGFCVTCTELLCDECFRYHLKPSLTRNHKLLGLEDAKKDQSFAISRDICKETCREHPQEIIKYFCKIHNTLGCSACMTVEHRSCKGVQHIPKVTEAEANGHEYTRLVQELDTVLLRTRRLIKDSTDNKAKSQKMCAGVLDDVRKAKKEVIEAFEKLERGMKAEADKTKNKQIQKMDENIAVFDNIQQRAETLAKSLKSLKANGQYCKLFTAIKVEKSDIQSLDAKLDKAANDNTVADFKFQPCKELDELLKLKDILGKVSQKDDRLSNISSIGKKVQKDGDTTNTTTSQMAKIGKKLSQDSIKSKAKKVGEINVKTDSDTLCYIQGLVRLPTDRRVAADWYNKKVKLIDVHQARVVSTLHVPGQPCDMTATDEPGEIAVTLGGLTKILVVKVTGDSLLKDREIKKTSSACYGIASVKGSSAIGLYHPYRLEIIDKNGTVLHRIEHDHKRKQLFKRALSIAANQQHTVHTDQLNEAQMITCTKGGSITALADQYVRCEQGDTIYVSDSVLNTLTSLSASGELRAVHKYGELKRARCAVVDYRGTVYVGGDTSNNIIQINPDSSEVRVLLSAKDGISNPRSLY